MFVGNEDINDLSANDTLSPSDFCGELKGPLLTSSTGIKCNSTSGRYVTIVVTKNCTLPKCPLPGKAILSLCEVNLLVDHSQEITPDEDVPWYYLGKNNYIFFL